MVFGSFLQHIVSHIGFFFLVRKCKIKEELNRYYSVQQALISKKENRKEKKWVSNFFWLLIEQMSSMWIYRVQDGAHLSKGITEWQPVVTC